MRVTLAYTSTGKEINLIAENENDKTLLSNITSGEILYVLSTSSSPEKFFGANSVQIKFDNEVDKEKEKCCCSVR